MTGIAEREAENGAGRADDEVVVPAGCGAKPDDPDDGQSQQHDRVGDLGPARRRRERGQPVTGNGRSGGGHSAPPLLSRRGKSPRIRSASTVTSPDRLMPGGAPGSTRIAMTRTSGPKKTAAAFSAANEMTLPVMSISTLVSVARRDARAARAARSWP